MVCDFETVAYMIRERLLDRKEYVLDLRILDEVAILDGALRSGQDK